VNRNQFAVVAVEKELYGKGKPLNAGGSSAVNAKYQPCGNCDIPNPKPSKHGTRRWVSEQRRWKRLHGSAVSSEPDAVETADMMSLTAISIARTVVPSWIGVDMSDLIDRQKALDAIQQRADRVDSVYSAFWEGLIIAQDIVKNLPSAEPERKKGTWIEYPDCLKYEDAYSDDQIACSACHHVFSILDNCTEEFNFCPNCGADMRGE